MNVVMAICSLDEIFQPGVVDQPTSKTNETRNIGKIGINKNGGWSNWTVAVGRKLKLLLSADVYQKRNQFSLKNRTVRTRSRLEMKLICGVESEAELQEQRSWQEAAVVGDPHLTMTTNKWLPETNSINNNHKVVQPGESFANMTEDALQDCCSNLQSSSQILSEWEVREIILAAHITHCRDVFRTLLTINYKI